MNKRWKQILMIVFAVALLLPQFGIAQKASAAVANGNYVLKVQTTGGKQWDGVQIPTGASGLNLIADTAYTFSYDLYTPDQDVAGIVLQTSGYNWIKDSGALSAASPAWNSYSATYTYTAASGANIQFVKKGDSGATDAKNITYYIDNFVVKEATSGNVVYTADFEDQAAHGFTSSGTAALSTVAPPQSANNYFLKVQTTGGQQWDGAQIDTGASGLNLVADTAYSFSFDLYTPDKDVAGILLQTNGNYNWIKNTNALSAANPAWTSYTATYTYLAASGGQLQFVKTGDSGATDVKNITYYIDNFVVKDAASGNVVYTANFDDKATHGFASSGSAALSTVNSTSAATTPTINPDVLKLPSIKDTYPNYLMGSIIGPYYMQDSIMPVLKAQFGVVTSENAMKPASLIGTSASTHNVADLSFNEADKEVQSAIDNGLKVHGHTLVWEGQSIPWLNNAKTSDSDSTPSNPGLTAAGAYENMNAYINAVLTHFGRKFNASTQNIISWDVVNEAFSGSVRDSSLDPKDWHSYLKATPWLKATDENYVEQAFKYARAAEPDYNVLLYYNDYSMDDQNKAAAVRDMVKDINDRWAVNHPGKQLIQGVGLQEHNGLGTNPNNQRKTIQMFKNIGVKVSISELDISAGTNSQQTTEQVQAQAAQYARLMQVYTDPNFKDTVQRISFWGLTDTNSWLSSGSPLLFDGNLYPKDAFDAVIDPDNYLANYNAPTKPAGGKTSTAAKGTPSIDGTIDDIWNTTTPIDINVTQAGNTKADTHMPAATARMLWDNSNLYVLAHVTKDPSEPLDKGNANPWEQDSVEVVVDLTNGSSAMYSNASGHYRVRYDGFASVDAGMTDNQGIATTMTSATTYDEATNSYTVEMKIPFIQITPAIGTQIGFDVQVNDAKEGVRIGAFAWNDASGTAYQDLFKIGTLELAAAPTPPSTGPGVILIPPSPADNGSTPDNNTEPEDNTDQGDDQPVQTPAFNDLSTVPWATDAINRLAALGVINGETESTFNPKSPVKRSQLVLMLVRALDLDPVTNGEAVFKDVPASRSDAGAIAAAVQAGLIQGSGNSFRPNDAMTREEAIVVLMRAYRYAAETLGIDANAIESASTASFKDSDQLSKWAADDVLAAVNLGLVQGDPTGNFRAQGTITRAETAVVIDRMLQLLESQLNDRNSGDQA